VLPQQRSSSAQLPQKTSEPSPNQPGVRRLSLSIGGFGVIIESDEPDLRLTAEGAVARFVVETEPPSDLKLRTRSAIIPGLHDDVPVFDSGAVWKLFRHGDEFVFRFTSPFFGPAPYKIARVNRTFSEGEIVLHRPYFSDKRAIYPLEFPLDELLFIHLLAQGRGIELHGCAVVDPLGSASVFVGQSGAGKSTMAGLWHRAAGATILSDDRLIVRKIDGRMVVYGTPWHGDEPFASSGPAPLARIFFLRHGPANRLHKVSTSEAAARLLACSFVPFYDPRGMEFTLGFLDELTRGVPCHDLEFTPDQSVIDFVRRSV
jgi:hypothetical protein